MDVQIPVVQFVKLFNDGNEFGQVLQRVALGMSLDFPKGKGDAFDEMHFFLNQASETVSAQHLHQAEIDKSRQIAVELQGVKVKMLCNNAFIVLDELVAKVLRHLCFHLIQQRNHIVLKRSLPSALKIDVAGDAVVNHDVAGLEVAVHEKRVASFEDEVCKTLEISI